MVSLGERAGSPGWILKVTFSAGDVAAPARAPKSRPCAGQACCYLLMSLPILKTSFSSSMKRMIIAVMGSSVRLS